MAMSRNVSGPSILRTCKTTIHAATCRRTKHKSFITSTFTQAHSLCTQSASVTSNAIRQGHYSGQTERIETRENRPERKRTARERHLETTTRYFGELTPEAVRLRQSFTNGAADPFETLVQSIESGKADLEFIRICLGSAKERMQILPRSARAAAIEKMLLQRSGGFTASVLRYLFDDVHKWMGLWRDAEAALGLCYFAIAEGLDGVIEEWIRADVSKELQGTRYDPQDHYWRNVLASDLYEMFKWYDATTDRAVQRFLELNDWHRATLQKIDATFSNARHHFVKDFNLKLSAVKTLQLLTEMQFPHTDAESYERFQKFHMRNKRLFDPAGHTLNCHRLDFFHPTSPDARPFMSWLRKRLQDDILQDLPAKVAEIVQHSIHNVHALLQKQLNNEDARWLAEVYRKNFGSEIDEQQSRTSKFVSNRVRITQVKDRGHDEVLQS